MSKARSLSIYLCFLDLFVGFIFGSIGHFFSLLIFPMLAVLRGSLVGIYVEKDLDEKLIRSAVAGAASLFIGINIGVANLVFVLGPKYDLFQKTLGQLLESNLGLSGSLSGSLLCSSLYMVAYFITAYIAGILMARVPKN